MGETGDLTYGPELLERLEEAVSCYQPDGTIVYLNPTSCRILGQPRGQAVGQNLWQMLPDAADGPFRRAFEQTLRSGQSQHLESFYAPWGRWFLNHFYLADQKVWVFSRDITADKATTARVEILATASRVFSEAVAPSDSPAMFQRIARHLAELLKDLCSIRLVSPDGAQFEQPLGIWDTDPQVREMLEHTPSASTSEAIGAEVLRTRRSVMIAHIDPREAATRIAPSPRRDLIERLGIHSVMVAPLLAQGELLGIVSLCRRLTGTRAAYVAADLVVLEDLADRAALVVGQWRALRRAEESHRRLISIGNALPALLSLVGKDGRYQFVNAAYEKWFTGRREDLIGKTPAEVMGPTAYAIIEPHFRRALAGEVVTFEAKIPYDLMGERGVQATYTPYVVSGQIEGFIALVLDVTDRMRMADEREQILTDLRAAVAARDEFLSIASHELRTPLTSLDLQLSGIQRSLVRDPAQPVDKFVRRIETAARQADRLKALIDGLLNVSRIEMGRLHLEPADLDLVELVREVVERSEADATRAGSTISTQLPGVALARADRMRIDQALTNLLSNAIKYGAGRPIEVTLAEDGDQLLLAVRDWGLGIAPEDLTRIFGRFERAVASSHYGGLGLGLYIANQIVIAHGGTIQADGEPGRGATFTIRLPRRQH